MSAILSEENRSITVNEPYPIHWGAVMAGVIFAFAISWLLFMLGSAIGLSVFEFFDPYNDNVKPEAMTLNLVVVIWVFLSTIIAFYLGGLLAGRLTGIADRSVGLLHGLVVWATSVLVSIILGALGISGISSIAMNAVKSAATVGGASAYIAAEHQNGNGSIAAANVPSYLQPLVATLKREVSQSVAQNVNANTLGGADVSAKTIREALNQIDLNTLGWTANALVKGNTEEAKFYITSSTSLSDAEVDQLIATAKIKADQLATELKKKADVAQDYLTSILWLIFLSSAGALLASIIGGWMGVDSIKRIYSFQDRKSVLSNRDAGLSHSNNIS
jgi:hypothetical protein